MSRVFDCLVMTPEKIIYDGEAEFAVLQAHDGELGFLPDHMTLIGELGIGEMRIMKHHQVERIVIEGGIVEFSNNRVTVLTEIALQKQDLNIAELQEKLEILEADETCSKTFRNIERQRLKARIKLAMK